jgi:hypothetical protein
MDGERKKKHVTQIIQAKDYNDTRSAAARRRLACFLLGRVAGEGSHGAVDGAENYLLRYTRGMRATTWTTPTTFLGLHPLHHSKLWYFISFGGAVQGDPPPPPPPPPPPLSPSPPLFIARSATLLHLLLLLLA